VAHAQEEIPGEQIRGRLYEQRPKRAGQADQGAREQRAGHARGLVRDMKARVIFVESRGVLAQDQRGDRVARRLRDADGAADEDVEREQGRRAQRSNGADADDDRDERRLRRDGAREHLVRREPVRERAGRAREDGLRDPVDDDEGGHHRCSA
jgi:hypothetical protein